MELRLDRVYIRVTGRGYGLSVGFRAGQIDLSWSYRLVL